MAIEQDFTPSNLALFRTPLLPREELEAWAEGLAAPELEAEDAALEAALERDRALLRARLRAFVARPEVREALFLASPHLEESLAHWQAEPESKKGQRSEHGLVRYFLRMTSRPTPFGLFSGCSVGGVGDETRLALAPRETYQRHSRFDMDYLFALCEALAQSPEARGELLYRPNPSLLASAGRLRYAEARLAGRIRTYHLVAVEAFEALSSTLEKARGGARLAELAAFLVAADPEGEITLEDAEAFVHELVDVQLLLPQLGPPVTGEEATPALLRQLAAHPFAGEAHARLAEASRALEELDRGLGHAPERYREVAALLEPLGVPVELARLVQVDLVKPSPGLELSQEVAGEVLLALELLHQVSPPRAEGPLSAFRQAFLDRYGENRPVPLLEALDEEGGIGFGRSNLAGAEASPLLAGLPLKAKGDRGGASWTPRHEALLELLSEALAAGRREVELSDALLARLAEAERPPLPDALAALVVFAAPSGQALAAGDYRLLVSHGIGPSGARLVGRFCHADPELARRVREHLAAEEAHNPEAVYAELVHLPEGRVGNILARPLLRDHEIPFLGVSGAPGERQIEVSDLVVTVIGERVVLRSQTLGCEVLPRLTTAHNTSIESLGLYRFLAALQSHERGVGLGWDWGPFAGAPFLPRVSRGRVVLAKARWRLSAEEVQGLAAVSRAERYRRAQALRAKRRLPRWVSLLDGENELAVDLANPLVLDALVEEIKGRDGAVLTELWPAPEELCVTGPEGRFVHEAVVPFVRRLEAAVARPRAPKLSPARVPRLFPPGSDWLYAKLYAGTATADAALRESLGPFAREAVARGWARSWFFLRYGDPAWHLRLRLRAEPERLHGELLPAANALFAELQASGFVWKVQLDTYEREIERYGGPEGIELAEELFGHDSEAVAAMLESCEGDAGADLRWRLALLGLHRFYDDLGLDLEWRWKLAERARTGFAGRYQAELLKAPLAERLRREKQTLERWLEGELPEAARPAHEALERRSQALAPLLAELRRRESEGRLTASLLELTGSFQHMFINRLTRSAGPEHELVLYDFLSHLYASKLARQRKEAGRVGAPVLDSAHR